MDYGGGDHLTTDYGFVWLQAKVGECGLRLRPITQSTDKICLVPVQNMDGGA